MRLSPVLPAILLALTALIGCSKTTGAEPSACPGGGALAVGGPDRVVAAGTVVQLEGSAFGASGEASYLWRLESIPPGSGAHLDSAEAPVATFVADRPGTYLASLLVRDACGDSVPDVVAITVPGNVCLSAPPVARIAGAATVSSPLLVTLDGSGSTGAVSYRWELVSAPAGSTASFTAPLAATTGFRPDRRGSYQVSLVVRDTCQESAPATTSVVMVNTAPTAFANTWDTPLSGQPLRLSASVWDEQGDPVTVAWTVQSAPAGSTASISSPTTLQPTFTPDRPGPYTLSLVASDGLLQSAPALVQVVAQDLPPVAVAGADRAAAPGSTVVLDGATSADPNGTPLEFAWALEPPAGSAATLDTPAGATAAFVPDVPGVYLARLTVRSAGASGSAEVSVAAWPALQPLAYRVLGAAYAGALDRLVTVSADPNVLHLLDPRTGAEEVVALPAAPLALALSPDGRTGAVAHAAGVSRVDLAAAALVDTTAFGLAVSGLALDEGGVAYLTARPSGTYGELLRVRRVQLGGAESADVATGVGTPGMMALRPGAAALYVSGGNYASAALERYDLSGAVPTRASWIPWSYNREPCGAVWLSAAGDRLYTGCGHTFVASSGADDLGYAGSLAGTGLSLRQLADSAAAGTVSALARDLSDWSTSDADRLLRWRSSDLSPLDRALLPRRTVGGIAYRYFGRGVFYRADGTERYVLLQLDQASGILDGFALATF